MQTLANFELCSANWPLVAGLATFRYAYTVSIAMATRCNQHQSQDRTGLYFEYANDDIHLPKNPLGLIVNGLCFPPDNVFSIRCIFINFT